MTPIFLLIKHFSYLCLYFMHSTLLLYKYKIRLNIFRKIHPFFYLKEKSNTLMTNSPSSSTSIHFEIYLTNQQYLTYYHKLEPYLPIEWHLQFV